MASSWCEEGGGVGVTRRPSQYPPPVDREAGGRVAAIPTPFNKCEPGRIVPGPGTTCVFVCALISKTYPTPAGRALYVSLNVKREYS